MENGKSSKEIFFEYDMMNKTHDFGQEANKLLTHNINNVSDLD